MPTGNSFWEWLVASIDSLPRSSDPFFKKLWKERRLKYVGGHDVVDGLDEYSARLACATLSARDQLLIVFPDNLSHRSPLAFATCLVMHALDQLAVSRSGGRVLYFGSTIGVRRQLAETRVGDLNLGGVFSGRFVSTRTTNKSEPTPAEKALKGHLPEVVCVYSPGDPVVVVAQNSPEWIAIDCGEETRLRWLGPLLEYARAQRLPVLAWTSNPLAQSIEEFVERGVNVFRWPRASVHAGVASPLVASPLDGGRAAALFGDCLARTMVPLLLELSDASVVVRGLKSAYESLRRASQRASGRLSHDALRLGWRYLWALEALSVPLGLYEAESPGFWGLSRISHLQDGFRRFVETVERVDPEVAADLGVADSSLAGIVSEFDRSDPPLWTALSNLSTSEGPADSVRSIVFSGSSRKRLFSFALLARYNLTDSDLAELGVEVTSVAEFRQRSGNSEPNCSAADSKRHEALIGRRKCLPLLVGLPSPQQAARLEPVLTHERIEVLLYPYQGPSLARCVGQWNMALMGSIGEDAAVLARLGNRGAPPPSPELPPCLRLTMASSVRVSAEGAAVRARWEPFWKVRDPVAEVTRLLGGDLGEDEVGAGALGEVKEGDSDGRVDGEEKGAEGVWLTDATEIAFDDGSRTLLAQDEMVNVISRGASGDQVEERYVQALRAGDRMVFIDGQRRQSLYELIISRVHRDPAIELHLAFIRRWHEDVARAYELWCRLGRGTLATLYRALQERGTSVTSPMTVRGWVRGDRLCPEDPGDLERLGAVLRAEFVSGNCQRIHRAALRLRGLHRGLANRLNNWLRHQAAGMPGMHDEEVVDGELRLTFGDFRRSLVIVRVASVRSVTGPFLREALGRLERTGQL